MLKSKKTETLADKISGILSTTPASFDPDEEIVGGETVATVVEKDSGDEEQEDFVLSKFRQQNVDLLEDIDVKYAGKTSTRKNLEEQWDSNDEASTQSEEWASATDDEDAEIKSDGAAESLKDEVDDGSFKHVRDSDVSGEIKKGLCVRNQLNIWESLLEIRIQLQKCLVTANKMPQKQTFNCIRNESGESFISKVAETKKNLANTLDKFLDLQRHLQKQYPETKSLLSSTARKEIDAEDEEIPSDDDDDEGVEAEESEEDQGTPKKRRKFADYENYVATRHDKYKNYCNSVIQKWYDKTRIDTAAAKQKTTTQHSILNQIEYHLSDKEKLRKRTQTKRSEYTILGVAEESETNTEIFDDDDFYHQLLRELIEVKSADVTDPIQLGRQWIRLQNLRSKMKRKIDTRATKGRKVRYTVHTKLVNFMAPIDHSAWTDEAKTELFCSLFGKNQNFSSM